MAQVPDVKSNLGAFAQYGKLAAGAELQSLDALGAFIGLLGDVAGAVGLVVGLLGVFGALTSHSDNALAGLSAELAAVDKQLRALIGSERADHLLARLRGLDSIAGPADTAFQRLKTLLPPNPPPTAETTERLLGGCVDALILLENEDQWKTNVFETPYYSDGGAWAGEIAAEEVGGLAFSTKYIMPTFLRTLCHFITFGGIFDPRFVSNNEDLLRRCLKRLQTVYDQASAGIVMIPRAMSDDVLQRAVGADGSVYEPGLWSRGRLASASAVGFDPVFYRMYGAVSRFGEYFEIGNFPPSIALSMPMNLPEPPAGGDEDLPPDYFLKFNATYDLKRVAARKTTYRALGLGATRSSIRSLQRILGDDPIDAFDPELWWSVREVRAILAPAFDDPSQPPLVQTTARAALGGLNALSGTAQSSLRAALEALTLPIELAPLPPTNNP